MKSFLVDSGDILFDEDSRTSFFSGHGSISVAVDPVFCRAWFCVSFFIGNFDVKVCVEVESCDLCIFDAVKTWDRLDEIV